MRFELDAIRRTFGREGRVEWIGLRPGHRQPMVAIAAAKAIAGRGLTGDRAGTRADSKRQVTLIQAEHLPVIASLVGLADVRPELLRRNLVVSGINVIALQNKRFCVGKALLRGTGSCHPCARMEEALGHGGYNALRGHGGITAQVITGGTISVGDAMRAVIEDART